MLEFFIAWMINSFWVGFSAVVLCMYLKLIVEIYPFISDLADIVFLGKTKC